MNRDFFAGGNTGEGFYDLFDYILPKWEEKSKTYILKGGPGVGKNTMMKEIARTAMENGYDTELFYCAGDPDSLDAVHIPQKHFVILDGTSPHVREPKIPGVTDSIVNLGIYLQESELKKHWKELSHLFEKNKKYYEQSYLFLKMAAVLSRKERNVVSIPKDADNIRKLFLQAITHQGYVDLSEDFLKEKIVMQVGEADGADFVTEMKKKFEGCKMEVFADALLPEALRYIYIPSSELVIEIVPEKNSEQAEEFLQDGISCLKKCKKAHDEIEVIYKASMNFSGVNKETKQLLKEII